MLPYDDLPIILVSAGDETAAAKIISDIIDNEVSEVQCDATALPDRVWRLANKYYTADVRLQPLIDNQPSLLQLDNMEAHIVYLTEEECAGTEETVLETFEARVRRAGAAGRGSHVRLVAAECGEPPGALAAAATRLRLELVPLRVERTPHRADPEEHDEERGLSRVRAALHAHTWRGLELSAPAPATSPPYYRERSCSGSETSSSCGAAEESDGGAEAAGAGAEAVERAEAFAEALGALRGAAEQCAALGGGAERARRADLLLAAFCRALGHRLDTC